MDQALLRRAYHWDVLSNRRCRAGSQLQGNQTVAQPGAIPSNLSQLPNTQRSRIAERDYFALADRTGRPTANFFSHYIAP